MSTAGFGLNQTMLRIADPAKSLPFYQNVLGMTLLTRLDFQTMKFSLYFLGYVPPGHSLPTDRIGAAEYTFGREAVLELTHNWGTESDASFAGYHNGNVDPRGYGHIGITVPDVEAACARFESLGVEFVKRPGEGKMKGIAFIKDPDGYWIEILSAASIVAILGA